MRFRRWATAAGLAMVVTTAPGAFAGPYPPPSDGQGTVTPSRIKAGQCAVFSGDGFAPLASISVSDNGAGKGSAQAGADGSFSKKLCYGDDAKPGKHVLRGTGDAIDAEGGGVTTRTVSAVLIVQGVSQGHVTADSAVSSSVILPPADSAGAGGGSLAFTGAPLLVTALLAVLLVGAGSLLLLVSEARYRRQRRLA